MKKLSILLGVVALLVIGRALFSRYQNQQSLQSIFFNPTETVLETNTAQTIETIGADLEVVAKNLQIPWEIVFLTDGSMLVTERPGRLLHITAASTTPITVAGVRHVGEGGLMGLALHPQFAENQFIYLYLTTQSNDGLTNRVERYRFDATSHQLTDRAVIIENIPGASNHDGGRIAFGPDGFLYITTGDAEDPENAQDTRSLAGKILRLQDDGVVPADNPFGNAVYSYGHRNPQGIAWDSQGRLWETEHGPSGTQTGNDEVNLIEKGKNYGWPVIKGKQEKEGMVAPILESGTKETWAPGGVMVADGRVLFVGLRGESIYSALIAGSTLQNVKSHFREEFGRLRVITEGPDGWIYIATSNTDGRGQKRVDDDMIIKIKKSALE